MSILNIKNLHKSYKHGNSTTHVLKGINLDIEEGSFVSILGRSGSGKTTLLNVMSTLMEHDKGKIIIDRQDISKLRKRKINVIRNNYIGFVFQEFNLVKDMSVLDNVATPLILNGVSFKKARQRAALMEVLGFSVNINLLDFDQMAEVIPLIEDFETDYELEIAAIYELEDLIGIINEDRVIPGNEEDEPNGEENSG